MHPTVLCEPPPQQIRLIKRMLNTRPFSIYGNVSLCKAFGCETNRNNGVNHTLSVHDSHRVLIPPATFESNYTIMFNRNRLCPASRQINEVSNATFSPLFQMNPRDSLHCLTLGTMSAWMKELELIWRSKSPEYCFVVFTKGSTDRRMC
jgi:hypothetical protein